MTIDFPKRPLCHLKRPVSPFSETYGVYQRHRDERNKATADHREAEEKQAAILAELAAEHYLLSRELQLANAYEIARPLLNRIENLMKRLGVISEDPTGAELSRTLEECVEILGTAVRDDLSATIIDRVDRPIVRIGERIFKGRVRTAEPRD
jgi:hypothetical protein